MGKISFQASIEKYGSQGEKTGWTYIAIPPDLAETLKPGIRQSFRVKGKLDQHKIAGVAILPVGGGQFILPLNATIRKAIRKKQGAMLQVDLQEDKAPFVFNATFLECLADEPQAQAMFQSLTGSHQRYFSKWIDEAKTEATRVKRIAMAVTALGRNMGFSEMIRYHKAQKGGG